MEYGVLLENSVRNPYSGQMMSNKQVFKLKKFIQQKILRLTGMSRFPGSHPVSLTKNAVDVELRRHRYYVCEKTDGERYLLFVMGKYGCFLINRKNQYFWVKIAVPKNGITATYGLPQNWQLEDHLFDGELVVGFDKVPVFYAFDTLAAGTNVMSLPLTDRLRIIHSDLVGARQKFSHWKNMFAGEPFIIKAKAMYRAEDVKFVFENVLPNLPHEQDGLIYTPVDKPYRPGTDFSLFKWKPPSMNSVDFLFKEPDKLYCSNRGNLEQVATLKDSICASNTIIECVLKDGEWTVMRTREDKTGPNDIGVYHKIMESIRNPVLKKHLL